MFLKNGQMITETKHGGKCASCGTTFTWCHKYGTRKLIPVSEDKKGDLENHWTICRGAAIYPKR